MTEGSVLFEGGITQKLYRDGVPGVVMSPESKGCVGGTPCATPFSNAKSHEIICPPPPPPKTSENCPTPCLPPLHSTEVERPVWRTVRN